MWGRVWGVYVETGCVGVKNDRKRQYDAIRSAYISRPLCYMMLAARQNP